jgi:hypothetical protein
MRWPWVKWIALILGVVAVLLGGLWLLQGLGLLHIQPILCVAECEAVENPSMLWALLGFILLIGGTIAITRSIAARRS